MKEILQQAAEEFSKTIDSSKKILVYTDDDADGICAAALVAKFLQRKGAEVDFLTFGETRPFSQHFIKKAEEKELVILLDLPLKKMGFAKEYAAFAEKHKTICIDHHDDPHTYEDLYLNTARIQDTVPGLQYCCSKFVFDILTILDPGMKQYAWLASAGLMGDYNYFTWKKIVQFAIDQQNKIQDTDFAIPQTNEDFQGCIFDKQSDLLDLGCAKKDAKKICYELTKCETYNDLEKLTNPYKPLLEDVQDYVENFIYFMKNAPYKEGLRVFEVEVKNQYDIRRIVANKLSFIDEDVCIFTYNRNQKNICISIRLQNKKLDFKKVFAQINETFKQGSLGGQDVIAGGVVLNEHFNDFKKIFYEVLGHD